jgi:cytochrome c biogenesis protein CcmG/thiol:disulfide interchange protein DsbE
MKKLLPFLTLIFLVGVIAISTYNLNKKQETDQENLISNTDESSNVQFIKAKILLPEFSLPDLYNDDKDFSKKNLTGKYSLINFFASWCTTCLAEHEILLRLKSENIIDIYGIAWRDIDENTKNFLKENGNPFKLVAKDSRGLFTKITGIIAVPETLIVDQNGNVVMRYRGNLQDFAIDEIKDFLQANSH